MMQSSASPDRGEDFSDVMLHHMTAQCTNWRFQSAPPVDSIVPTATGSAGRAAEAFTAGCDSVVPLPTEGSAAWLVDDCLSCATCTFRFFWAVAVEQNRSSGQWGEGYRRTSFVAANLRAGAVTLRQLLNVCMRQASETDSSGSHEQCAPPQSTYIACARCMSLIARYRKHSCSDQGFS